jgi:hypothetical protein
MRVRVNVKDGPHAGKQAELTASARLSVGRSSAADWALPEDRFLSNRHFEIVFENGACVLRDLESANGTFLDGRRITEEKLTRDCTVVAGRTTFAIGVELNIAAMLAAAQPLYAILDAAHTPRILELLSAAKERFECLYNGQSAVHLASCAPYLVELPPRSRLLRKLVREGWGQNWGIYLVCGRPFEEVRKHFRQFLKIKDDAGSEYYFRFYDPRVARVFLATCNAEERVEFCGPVERMWADDAAPLAGAIS